MDNLEKSELVIAKILGLLMEWGLADTELKFEELELDEEFLPFFATCVEWLEREGIIRARKVHQFKGGEALVVGPTLTARGLALMGNHLKIGDAETTVGEAVKETKKETTFYTGLGDFGGGFVGGLFKSLGSG